jgi:hypothetical protein
MKILDSVGLRRALSELRDPSAVERPRPDRVLARRRKFGLSLSLAGLLWSAAVWVSTWFCEPPISGAITVPMVFLAIGAFAYVFAAHHADGNSDRTLADRVRSTEAFLAEVGSTSSRMPAWAIVVCLLCFVFVIVTVASQPSRSDLYAVQDQHGYWLETVQGAKVGSMTEKEFRNFRVESSRPLATISLTFSVFSAMGFWYGPGGHSGRRKDRLSTGAR